MNDLTRSKYLKYKTKYLKLKADLSEGKYNVVTREIDGKVQRFNNASVLIVEQRYDNHNGRDEPCLILFHNKRWDTYVTPGGKVEKPVDDFDETLLNTAKRELQEETLNAITITDELLRKTPYVDVYNSHTDTYYRVFIIVIKHSRSIIGIYHDNKNTLSGQRTDEGWNETSGISRFYISDLMICIKNIDATNAVQQKYDNMRCTNTSGKQVNIYYKVVDIMNSVMETNILDEVINNTNKTRVYGFSTSNAPKRFLIGTKTMEIH